MSGESLRERIAREIKEKAIAAKTQQVDDGLLVALREGAFVNPLTGQVFKIEVREMPNLGEHLSTGKLKRIAGTRRRRRRTRRNVK